MIQRRTHAALRMLTLLTLGSWVSPRASHADIVRLKDGRVMAGSVVAGADGAIRLRSGGTAGPQEYQFNPSEILTVLHGLDETAEIGRAADPGLLVRWCEEYFHADMASMARQCIDRAVRLSSALKVSPRTTGSPEFQIFWNKQMLSIRLGEADKPDGAALLELARWAESAGLKADARELLKQAGFKNPESRAIRRQAADWGVEIHSWVQPDLRPALEMSLFTRQIHDAGVDVRARPGYDFFLLPLRYDSSAGRRVISRAVLDKKDRSAFYGLYALHRPASAAVLQSLTDGVCFERMELKIAVDGAPVAVWKDNLAPRKAEGDASRREPVRTRPESERPDGFAVLVLEVENSASGMTLQWDDGSSESLDLSLIYGARNAIDEMAKQGLASPEIDKTLHALAGRSDSMAELALVLLGMMRQRLPAEQLEAWSLRVVPHVLEAAQHDESNVRIAGWRYFSLQTKLSATSIRLIESASARMKRRWIEILDQHAGDRDAANSGVEREFLFAMLRTGPVDVCEKALAVLRRHGIAFDWSEVSQAAENAQIAALHHLATLQRDEAISALVTIMKTIRPASASEVAGAVRALNLRIDDPRDPLLSRWTALKDDADRIALLTVLRAATVGDVMYSEPYALMVHDGLRPGKSGSALKDQVLETVVEHAGKGWNSPGTRLRPDDVNTFSTPVRVRIMDPVLLGLQEAALSDRAGLRHEAIRLLIRGGFADAAANAWLEFGTSPEDLAKEMRPLLANDDIASSDGFATLCGRLLEPRQAAMAGELLDHLTQLNAAMAPSDSWRLVAALKAGLDVEAFADLARELKPSLAVGARRWLHRVCHFSLQDGQTFDAAKSPEERRATLMEIDLRRALICDGRYGALAVVELTTREKYRLITSGDSEAHWAERWSAPVRAAVRLAPLELIPGETGTTYQVRQGDRLIGSGVPRTRARPVRRPLEFMPALMDAGPALLGDKGWGWPAPTTLTGFRSVAAQGPAILPGVRPVMEPPREDFMTVDITASLGSALEAAGLVTHAAWERRATQPVRITLRYSSFAAYVGVSPQAVPPDAAAVNDRHVLSVMLVLEKMD